MGKLNKQPIRDFMQAHYTDQRLADLLCHARDGKLSFGSCCCFIGVATSPHALQVERMGVWREPHLEQARNLPGAFEAEIAFDNLGNPRSFVTDAERRRILIPIIRAEMKRRANLRKVTLAAELNQPASPTQSIQESVLEQDVAK